MKNNVKVYNPTFTDLSLYFSNKLNNSFERIINYIILLVLRIMIKARMIKCIDFQDEKDNNSKNKDTMLHSRIIAVKGWYFRDESSFFENAACIRQRFTPGERYLNSIYTFIKKMRSKYKYVIGIHVRRGDYQEWNNGKYCFSDHIYLNYIKQLKNILNEDACYIIVSNEVVTDILSIRDCFIHRGHAIEDLYLLSMCDYILGPPSTYSAWASFYGSVPLCYIFEENQNITLNNFKVFT
jgi:hypothetical protein